MKIRKGFVSNSSSSSFIIDANKYTCVDIAKHMTEKLLEQDTDCKDKCENIFKNLKKLENKNIGVYIELSDDIQIAKYKDKIYVDACYHYEWDLDSIDRGEEGEYHDEIRQSKFYFPDYDYQIIGKLMDWDKQYKYKKQDFWRCEYCEKGRRFIEVFNDILVCPNCLRDPDGKIVEKLFRKDKVKRILKK
jgi:hypothetical protein